MSDLISQSSFAWSNFSGLNINAVAFPKTLDPQFKFFFLLLKSICLKFILSFSLKIKLWEQSHGGTNYKKMSYIDKNHYFEAILYGL